MRLNGLDDEYVDNLCHSVALRMGPWRARNELLIHSNHRTNKAISTDANGVYSNDNIREREQVSDCLRTCIDAGMLMGWGSNEYSQLGTHTQVTHSILQLQATCGVIQLKQGTTKKSVTIDILEESRTMGLDSTPLASETSDKAHSRAHERHTADEQFKRCQVLCGAAFSAFLCPLGILSIWGKYSKNFLKQSVSVDGEENNSTQQEVGTIRDIVGAALGYEHVLLLCKSGWVLALGDNNWGQCEGPRSFVRTGSVGTKSVLTQIVNLEDVDNIEAVFSEQSAPLQGDVSLPSVQVLKLAAGVRHSAAITMDGYLHVRGTGSAARIDSPSLTADIAVAGDRVGDVPTERESDVIGQPSVSSEDTSALPLTNHPWRPPNAKLIDVSCGLHHTVVVDDRGRVWSFGDDKFGSLGRSATVPIPNAPSSSAVDSSKRTSDTDNAVTSTMSDTKDLQEGIKIDMEGNERSGVKKGRKGKDRLNSKDSVPRLVEGLEPGVRWQRVRIVTRNQSLMSLNCA